MFMLQAIATWNLLALVYCPAQLFYAVAGQAGKSIF